MNLKEKLNIPNDHMIERGKNIKSHKGSYEIFTCECKEFDSAGNLIAKYEIIEKESVYGGGADWSCKKM